jgi:cytoskeletal protein CcmA (bactofilin family)
MDGKSPRFVLIHRLPIASVFHLCRRLDITSPLTKNIVGMGHLQKRHMAFGVIALLAGLLAYAGTFSASYGACQGASAVYFADELAPTAFERARTFLICEGAAIDANTDLLIAVATFALAALILTWIVTTWSATRMAPAGAKNSASPRQAEKARFEASLPSVSQQTPPLPLAPSIVSVGAVLSGTLTSQGDYRIEGGVAGDIYCAGLTVSETGQVHGEIFAQDVVVRGAVRGSICAQKIVLCAGSRVEGDILQAILVIENGAEFNGRCRHSNDPVPRISSGKVAMLARMVASE